METVRVYLEACIYPLAALILSLLFTRICIGLLPRLGLVDVPDCARRIHTRPTPVGGGIAVALAFFIATGAFAVFHPGIASLMWKFSIPAGVLLITGLIDDRFEVSAKVKLLMQVIVGVLVWVVGERITNLFGLELGPAGSLVVTTFWVVAIVNAFNLIDGLDGVASGLGVVAALCLGVWCFLSDQPLGNTIVLFIMGASCLGFLRYNFSPARIFLGDTGAMFIGLFFAYFGLAAMGKMVTMTTLLVPVLAVGVPVLDTALAFWRRLMRRLLVAEGDSGKIMKADREHLHHRLLDRFASQRQAALFIYMIGGIFAGAGIAFMLLDSRQPALAYLIILTVVLFSIRRLAVVELNVSADALVTGFRRPRITLLFPMLQPFVDLFIVIGGYIVTRLLLRLPLPETPYLLWHMVPVLACLLISGSYWTYWLRAGLIDYWRTFEWACIGLAVGLYGAHLFYGISALYAVLLGSITLLLLMGQRLLCRFIGGWVLPVLLRRRKLNQEFIPVVMFGGGLNCQLYLACINGLRDRRPLKILGIIDDDPALRFLRIHGLPIIGNSEELEELHRRYRFQKIVVTPAMIEEERFQRLRDFASAGGVELIHFEIREKQLGAVPVHDGTVRLPADGIDQSD